MFAKVISFLMLLSTSEAWIFRRFGIRTEAGSPYPMKTDKRRYFIDIDGTICNITASDYPNSQTQ